MTISARLIERAARRAVNGGIPAWIWCPVVLAASLSAVLNLAATPAMAAPGPVFGLEEPYLVIESVYEGTLTGSFHTEGTEEERIHEELTFKIDDLHDIDANGLTVEEPTTEAHGTGAGNYFIRTGPQPKDFEERQYNCTFSSATNVNQFGPLFLAPSNFPTIEKSGFKVLAHNGKSQAVEFTSNPDSQYEVFAIGSYLPVIGEQITATPGPSDEGNHCLNGVLGDLGAGENTAVHGEQQIFEGIVHLFPGSGSVIRPELRGIPVSAAGEPNYLTIPENFDTTVTELGTTTTLAIHGTFSVRVKHASEVFPRGLEQIGPSTPVPPATQHDVPQVLPPPEPPPPPVEYAGGGGTTTLTKGGGGLVGGGLKAHCPTTAKICHGHATVTAALPVGLAREARTTSRTVTLGVASFTLASGQSKVVSVEIARKVVGLLRRLHHLQASIVVSVSAAGARKATVVRRSITLSFPKTKHH